MKTRGYPGNKSSHGVYQQLINLIPPHTVYAEPFLGAAKIMQIKRPALLNIGVDLDPESYKCPECGAENYPEDEDDEHASDR